MKFPSKPRSRFLLEYILLVSSLLFILIPRVEAQTWTVDSPMQVARWSDTATLLTNGTVLISGGEIYNEEGILDDTNECEIFDPQTGNPTPTGFMQYTRHQQSATLLTNGQVLVSGGGGSSSEVYDPGSGSWINFASMNDERIALVAVLLPNGQVLAAGGYNDNSGNDLSSAEVYDPTSSAWSSVSNMPYATDSAAAVVLTNGTVLVCGGSDASQGIYYESNTAIYHPASQTWTSTTSMNEARAGHTATLLQNGKVLVEGGTGDASAEIYDPVGATWTMVASMNDGRLQSDAVLLKNGTVMVTGDDNADVEIYDPSSDTWALTNSLPVPGYLQAMTLLAGGQVLVTGGSQSQYNGPAINVEEIYGSVVVTPSLTVSQSVSNGAPPLTVKFTSPSVDSNGGTVTNWSWSFGDGATSTSQSPTHVYQNAGTFTPSLVAYSTDSSSSLAISGLSTISIAIPSLTAAVNSQSGVAALTVQFSTPGVDSDGFTVTNWSWTFGDGGTSAQQNPIHTYSNAGVYSPTLVARSTYSSSPVATIYGFGSITVTNSPNPAFKTLYGFTARSGSSSTNLDGSEPNGGLIILSNSLYGTTERGGTAGDGTLFAVHTDGSGYTNLYNFNITAGAIPPAGVIASGNTLFGTTYVGGGLSGGTIFSINSSGNSYSNLLLFSLNVNPALGDEPEAAPVLDGNILYVPTWFGGAYDHGTISFASTNGLSSGRIQDFNMPTGPNFNMNFNGLYPSSRLIASGGLLFGTAEQGGTYGYGTLFLIGTNSPYNFTPLHDFTAPDPVAGTNLDGANPFAGVVLSGATLYGATFGGGAAGNGAIFAVGTNGMGFTNLYSFKGGTDGSGPHGSMTMVGSTLYGTTSSGGAYTNGTLFSINSDGSGYRTLYNFSGGADGGTPQADLLVSSNIVYGAAASGGATGNGCLFSYVLPAQLNIALAGTNVILTWSVNAAGYSLLSSPKLQTGAVWSAVSPLPVVINGLNTVTNAVALAPKFYRLSR